MYPSQKNANNNNSSSSGGGTIPGAARRSLSDRPVESGTLTQRARHTRTSPPRFLFLFYDWLARATELLPPEPRLLYVIFRKLLPPLHPSTYPQLAYRRSRFFVSGNTFAFTRTNLVSYKNDGYISFFSSNFIFY